MTDLTIARPYYPSSYDFIDKDCRELALYLYENVNETFYTALSGNVIKTVRYENDPFIPINDFPVLKVYKKGYSDTGDLAPQLSTQFNISYALAYTQRTKLVSVTTHVIREIRRLLKNGSYEGKFQLDWSSPIQVSFEDFINPDNVIYKYGNLSCSLYTYENYS